MRDYICKIHYKRQIKFVSYSDDVADTEEHILKAALGDAGLNLYFQHTPLDGGIDPETDCLTDNNMIPIKWGKEWLKKQKCTN